MRRMQFFLSLLVPQKCYTFAWIGHFSCPKPLGWVECSWTNPLFEVRHPFYVWMLETAAADGHSVRPAILGWTADGVEHAITESLNELTARRSRKTGVRDLSSGR